MQFVAISLLPLLSAILVLFLGIVNFFAGKKSRINTVFTLITLAVSIWLFGTFMMFSSQGEWEAIFWDRFIYIGVVFVPALMYHFSVIFCEQKKQDIFVFLGYLLSFFFLWASQTDLFVSGVFRYQWGVHTQARFLHNVFLAEFIFFLILTLNNFYLHYRNPELTALDRTRAKYVFLAFFILITVGSTGFLPAYNISIWPFSYLSSVAFVLILAYAIMRFRLLDIGFFMTRGLIYIMISAFFYGVTILFYILFHSRVSGNMEITLWWAFAILNIYLFPKVLGLFERIAAKYFYYGHYSYFKVMDDLGKRMTRILEVERLSSVLIGTLAESLRIENMSIILKNRDGLWYCAKNLGLDSLMLNVIIKNESLSYFLEQSCDILVAEELTQTIEKQRNNGYEKSKLIELRETLSAGKIKVCLPLMIDNRLIGMVLIGEKLTRDSYSTQDFNLLSTVASQMSLAFNSAIKNATP